MERNDEKTLKIAIKNFFGPSDTTSYRDARMHLNIEKKNYTFFSYFFARSPNLQSEFENSDF